MQEFTIESADDGSAGIPRLNERARRRVSENPPSRDTSACQCCGTRTTAADLWTAQWSYYYTPNRAIAMLAPLAAVMGVALVRYTREVRHSTYHVICFACALSVKRNRLIGALLRFIGLFLAIISLGLLMAGIVGFTIAASAHDRSLIRQWIPVPAGTLVLGVVLARVAARISVPSPLRPLLRWPFYSTGLERVAANA